MSNLSDVKVPRVGIVGRPNVGKSSLFNKLTRSRLAMVKNEPGVTRDLLMEPCEWWGRGFEVVDTGGLTDREDEISTLIKEKVSNYLVNVDLIVFVVDGREGRTPEDQEVFRLVQELGKPFLTVVNKVDKTYEPELALSDFYVWGVDLLPVAFERDFNIDRIVEWILSFSFEEAREKVEGFRLSLVGKPNAGKSSLANLLLGEKRMLVSTVAGTTVDSVEESFQYEGKTYLLSDTAGLRKAGKRASGLETLGTFKTRDAIDRSELVLLVVDAQVGLTSQDARIVETCLEKHKALLLVVNKMDLADKDNKAYKTWFKDHVTEQFHFFRSIPYVFVSAKTGYGINSLFHKIEEIRERLGTRISTSKLNKFFTEVIKRAPSPVWGTENVKFYYLTQTKQKPPSFIAFANQPKGVTPAYRRFLINQIQKEFGLEGIPIRIFVLPKGLKRGSGPRSPKNVSEAENPPELEGVEFDLTDEWEELEQDGEQL
jgi:GTP-binding protein